MTPDDDLTPHLSQAFADRYLATSPSGRYLAEQEAADSATRDAEHQSAAHEWLRSQGLGDALPSPEDYDYPAMIRDSVFPTKDGAGRVPLPPKYWKPGRMIVGGVDLATGQRILSRTPLEDRVLGDAIEADEAGGPDVGDALSTLHVDDLAELSTRERRSLEAWMESHGVMIAAGPSQTRTDAPTGYYPRPNRPPTLDDLKAKGYIDADGKVAPKSYMTIYVGDYDSAAWLYQKLPQMWDDPARGMIPLGWAFNPNLADRFAPGMHYARKHKSDLDFFVSGDTGAGYVNPGHLQEPRRFSELPSGVRTWAEHCKPYYEQWDLSITGFIIDGYAPPMSDEVLDAYAEFSPDGIVAQKIGRWGVRKGMPYLRMDYDLVHSPEQSAQVVLSRITDDKPGFYIFRDILWTPTAQKQLFETIKASPKGADIEIVDPYTLMLLIKQNGAARD